MANAETGTLQVTVTGLPPLSSSGGTAVAQRTDSAGAPIDITVSPAGIGFATNVPVGTYTVTYTPPSGTTVTSANPVIGTTVPVGDVGTAVFSVAAVAGAGSIVVTVTGLTGSPPNGGTAVAQRTDSAGAPVNIVIPRSGNGGNSAVPAGTYTVTYTPPAGFAVTGTNTVAGLVVAAGGADTAAFSVAGIPGTGTIQVAVTGLSGPLANGGSAVAQRTDSAGTAITINVTAAGLGSATSVPTGTYSVTYTPPSGWSVASTNPVTGRVVIAGGTITASFAAVVTGSYPMPDVINNASFETGWDGFHGNGTMAPYSASPGVTTFGRDSTQAFAGIWSVLYSWTANTSDAGSYFRYTFAQPYDELWVRFYFRLAPGWSITQFQKFLIWQDVGGGVIGGLQLNDANGLWYDTYEECASHGPSIIPKASITTNVWHSIEVHYKRNGDALPWAEFWYDNVQLTFPDGAALPYGNTCAYWQGNKLYFGWPSSRGSYVQMDGFEWLATRNGGNTGSGTIWVDRMAVSSVGRIGP